MKLKQRETGRTGVMRACLDLLEAERIRHWRMNSGDHFGSYKGKTWRIRGHAKGTPDILASITIEYGHFIDGAAIGFGWEYPALLWIEVKAPGKHPTAEQLQFADEARANHELHLFVYDAKELQKWLKENRVRRGDG